MLMSSIAGTTVPAIIFVKMLFLRNIGPLISS
jgi:hypothetical protein